MPGLQLHVQSKSISFSEWLTLLTQAFAPLVAHIFVGVVKPTALSHKSIPWQIMICQYNPTSIIWRYFAVIDRRCRAKNWISYLFAATSAVFWDGTRLDGSQRIVMEMRDSAMTLPAGSHVSLVSKSAFHTLIVTLQGVQAVFTIFIHSKGKEAVPGHPISGVFFPLAVLGLLRLPAAPWLTEGEDLDPRELGSEMGPYNLLPKTLASPVDGDLPSEPFYPQWSWRGIAVRFVFLGVLLTLILSTIFDMVERWGPGKKYSLSSLLTGIYYIFLLVVTVLLFLIYILKKKANTTVIPCINSPFYFLYTLALILFSIVYIVLAALETRRTACGLYTTVPIEWGQDGALCKSLNAF